ncbi:MAG TPA: hypothetical protein VJ600_05840 [Holophagaceae bacterium]|nr:hypothetical protein [Holophagaceae bacterium]
MTTLLNVWRRLRWILAALLLLVGAWAIQRWVRVPRAGRVLILGASVEGLDPTVGRGLTRLVMDGLEVGSGATVLGVVDQVPPEALRDMETRDLLFRLSGRREGDALALELLWTTAGEERNHRPWRKVALPAAPPDQVLARLMRSWPLPRVSYDVRALAPRDPGRFWGLLQAMSVTDDRAALGFIQASRDLAAAEPKCAAAWTNLGEQLYRSLWISTGEAGSLPQNQALEAFDQALGLVPGYPRAAFLRGMMETDVGNQREALRGLVLARRRRPWVPDLYSGLAYAGRTSGLLDGALAAYSVRSELIKPFPAPSGWFAENTLLYTGRWDAFEQSLQAGAGSETDPVFLFYRGYLRLLRKDPEGALGFFVKGAENRETSMPFRELCEVYAVALEGRPDQALALLKTFDRSRGSLRIPDGELTFKIAEAYAYLDRQDLALDSAGRAFAQGFGCTRWYETSPIFAPARQHPRWTALHQHLQERQALLEKAFDPTDFKPRPVFNRNSWMRALPGNSP